MDQPLYLATARLLGLTVYNPAEPCPRGHQVPRRTSDDECPHCKSDLHRIGHLNRKARKLAKELGHATYQPAAPCINGHMAHRVTHTNACIDCEGPPKRTSSLSLRRMALAFGLTAYTPIAPCAHGHHGPRSTAYGYCYQCNDLANKRKLAEYKALKQRASNSCP